MDLEGIVVVVVAVVQSLSHVWLFVTPWTAAPKKILPASWEICMQVKKQQLEPDME